MGRIAIVTFGFLLVWMVFTSVFAASADKNEVRALPKWLWVILCLVVPFFGGLLYLMVGRPIGGDKGGLGGRGKTVAPDDDPNFLRDLNKKLRKKDEDDKK